MKKNKGKALKALPLSQNRRFKIVRELVKEEKKLLPKEIKEGNARREMETLAHIRGHPNINELVSYQFDGKKGRETGSLYLDFCDMGSLQAMLREHRGEFDNFPEEFIWDIMEGLAKAVEHCQYGPPNSPQWKPVYHSDIHPGNVFMKSSDGSEGPEVQAVLGDFGCALHPATLNDKVTGPVCKDDFETPELWEMDEAGATSDIYQIGIVAWCMVTASEDVHPEMMTSWVSEPTEIGGGRCSGNLLHIIWWCLQQDPAVRIPVKKLLQGIASFGYRAEAANEKASNA